jgi:hypothetical protein
MKLLSFITFLLSITNIFQFVEPIIKPIIKPVINKLNKKFLITNKDGASYCEKNSLVFMNSNNFFKDKKIISISPAGYYGFYLMGVCTYIKENYNTSKYIFSGASAGAWNSLYMTLKTDPTFMKDILVKNEVYQNKNVYQIEQEIKKNISQYYTTRDFDLDRLFIGVTTFGQTNIYTDFENLEDAIDCCIASSHIPFITGSLLYQYKNKCTFDGGFSEYPYLDTNQIALHITPNIWNQNEKFDFNLFKKDFFNLEKLFEKGYEDTIQYGKEILDKKICNYKNETEIEEHT